MQLEVVQPRGVVGAHAPGRRLGGVETSGAAWLAADGVRYAVVAYQRRMDARPPETGAGAAATAGGARCPLLVVDLLTGESVHAAAPCRPEERVRSLALAPARDLHGPRGAGPAPAAYAYVGLEDTRQGSENGAGRLVALALPFGAVVDVLPLQGTPVDLRLAAGGREAPAALYVLEQSGGAGGLVPTPEGGRVVVLDPLTLNVLGDHSLSAHASRLVPTPDGRSAFLVHQDTVQRLDLATGRLHQVARLPGRIVAAELHGDRLYLGSPEAPVVWVLDARTGYRQPDLRPAGPVASLALSLHRAG